MATDHGLHALRGKVGNEVYSIRNGKRIVRKASDKVPNQTDGTRKSAKDFGKASSAAALIRTGFKLLIQAHADNRFDDRLKSKAIQVVQSGPEKLKGSRRFTDGNMALLKGMELNIHTPVYNLLRANPVIEVVPGRDIKVALPRQNMNDLFALPPKAEVAVIQFRCCLLYFEEKDALHVTPEDLVVPLTKNSFPGCSLCLPFEGADNCVVMLALGVHFTTRDGGVIGNRKYYGGALLDVVHIENGEIKVFVPETVDTVAEPKAIVAPKVQWIMNDEE